MTFNTSTKSVLVLGATGRTGLECLRELSNHPSKPDIHAFCRDAFKFNENDRKLCASIVKGDARNPRDIENALRETSADVVVVSVGNGDSVKKSDIRSVSAQVLATAMNKPEFGHVKALVVSSAGAGTSKIIVGMGIGKLLSYHLRHVLRDHDGQEMAFSSPDLKKRTIIVRATGLTDNRPKGKIVSYGDKQKAPGIETDRVDLACWVADEICHAKWDGGKVINVTGASSSTTTASFSSGSFA